VILETDFKTEIKLKLIQSEKSDWAPSFKMRQSERRIILADGGLLTGLIT
jgi:hypothetical protein